MVKKITIGIIIGMMMLMTISALEFDNVKTYDDKTQTVVIENAFGLGEKIAEIKLETPLELIVPMGYQKVAEFQLSSLSDEYLNALKEIEFQDIKQGYKTIDRIYDYKYWGEITEQRTNYSCGWNKEIYSCIDNGKFDYKYNGWKELNSDTILKGNYTIGIFTTVNYGDKVEWIPTYYGVKINEWASYVQSSGTKITYIVGGLNYTVETFTSNGYFNTTKSILNISYLAVAGGGGGGSIPSAYHAPGGGGAGGINYSMNYNITAGSYVVEVGNGGNGGFVNQTTGTNGQNSSIGTIIKAMGGGQGAGYYGADIPAKFGGSGGGGMNAVGASGYGTQGNTGGTGITNGGGGGGGKGAVGANGDGTNGGAGGAGTSFNFNGTVVTYSGGGGGGSRSGTAGAGGTGGGGAGGTGTAGGSAGSANTGGGGGATGASTSPIVADGGDGGSGIVQIRYLTNDTEVPSPTVTLDTPINTTNSTSANIVFNSTVSGNILALLNVSLYINGTLNETNTSTTEGIYRFSKTMADGYYYWSILAFNTFPAGNQSENRWLTIDTTKPTIIITEQNYTYQNVLQNNTYVNWTYTEANPDKIIYNYNGTNMSAGTALYAKLNLTITDTDLQVWINDTFGNVGYDNYSWTVTPSIITIRAVNYLGNTISNVNFSGDVEYLGNPYAGLMSDYLNDAVTSINLSINATDLDYYNRNGTFILNVNATALSYNLTLNPNQLYLIFFNQSGGSNTTKFEIYDGEKLFGNDSADVLAVQDNLSIGNIYVRFNEDDYGTNWTQFYEYYNSRKTHITENLTLLNDADWVIYFKILSTSNRVIPNAVIRGEFANVTNGEWKNTSLIGQRLTKEDGTTFLMFDSSTYGTITITAEGYDAKQLSITIGDELAETKETAYTIYLDESVSGVTYNMWVSYPLFILNRTKNIEGYIMAKSSDQIKINTNYRVGLGLEPRTLTNTTGRGLYNATLIKGSDFSTSTTGNIIIYIYSDGELVNTWTITEKTPTEIFELPTLDDKIVTVTGLIGLVFIAGAVGMIFSSVTAGFTVFMFGTLAMSLINTQFLYLTIIGVIYFVMTGLRRFISE